MKTHLEKNMDNNIDTGDVLGDRFECCVEVDIPCVIRRLTEQSGEPRSRATLGAPTPPASTQHSTVLPSSATTSTGPHNGRCNVATLHQSPLGPVEF